MSLDMVSKFGATNLGLGEPNTEVLRIKKPALLNDMFPALFLDLLSLVEPFDLNVMNLSTEHQRRFL